MYIGTLPHRSVGNVIQAYLLIYTYTYLRSYDDYSFAYEKGQFREIGCFAFMKLVVQMQWSDSNLKPVTNNRRVSLTPKTVPW